MTVMRLDTWTRAVRARIARWTCTTPGCGAINPDITSACLRCGQ